MKIISWNVNGIRAVERKGFLDWLYKEDADIVCVQETKAHPDQLSDELLKPKGYNVYFNSAERKGYSGVAIFSKETPKNVTSGLGMDYFDSEGRVLALEYDSFILLNIYFPNGKMDGRLEYKLGFYDRFLEVADELVKKGKKLVICGDFNTAHKEIDLARPKQNESVSGFLPVERAWMDKFVKHGYIDTFRHFCDEPGHYSWWDMKTRARERNVGWRIDYFFVSKNMISRLKAAEIMSDVPGSDHCPVVVTV